MLMMDAIFHDPEMPGKGRTPPQARRVLVTEAPKRYGASEDDHSLLPVSPKDPAFPRSAALDQQQQQQQQQQLGQIQGHSDDCEAAEHFGFNSSFTVDSDRASEPAGMANPSSSSSGGGSTRDGDPHAVAERYEPPALDSESDGIVSAQRLPAPLAVSSIRVAPLSVPSSSASSQPDPRSQPDPQPDPQPQSSAAVDSTPASPLSPIPHVTVTTNEADEDADQLSDLASRLVLPPQPSPPRARRTSQELMKSAMTISSSAAAASEVERRRDWVNPYSEAAVATQPERSFSLNSLEKKRQPMPSPNTQRATQFATLRFSSTTARRRTTEGLFDAPDSDAASNTTSKTASNTNLDNDGNKSPRSRRWYHLFVRRSSSGKTSPTNSIGTASSSGTTASMPADATGSAFAFPSGLAATTMARARRATMPESSPTLRKPKKDNKHVCTPVFEGASRCACGKSW
jgi:hypothetical protein